MALLIVPCPKQEMFDFGGTNASQKPAGVHAYRSGDSTRVMGIADDLGWHCSY